jgi:predicted GNAT family acetyltransferase
MAALSRLAGDALSWRAQSERPVMDVRNNAALHRFELDADGHTAVAYYRLAPGVITFTHTEVPPALSGRGVGSRLARGALEFARAQGLKVVARCPFVAAYMAKHPEFNDLLL